MSKMYLYVILLLMLICPVASILAEYYMQHPDMGLIALVGKWFTFWAVGVRLFTAGIRQVKDPAFTTKDIFHIDNVESLVIVRELGFANICMGAVGIVSLFHSLMAHGSGLYGRAIYGHRRYPAYYKKTSQPQRGAGCMVSDLFILIHYGNVSFSGYYLTFLFRILRQNPNK